LVFCGFVACSGKFSTTGTNGLGENDAGDTGGATSGTGGATSTGGTRSTGGRATTGGATGISGSAGDGGGTGVSGAGGVVGTDASAGGGTGGIMGVGGAGTGGMVSTGGRATGGAVGTGGVNATGGAVATGGVNATGGAVATGGVNSTGGAIATGGVVGTGGVTVGCVPGALQCDSKLRCGNDGQWHGYICQPLIATDVINIDATSLPGFSAPGFRCKSLSVCGVSQSCHYSAQVGTGNLGSVQSKEDAYYDGLVLSDGQAVKIQIMVGAASQCGDPPITLSAGESIKVTLGIGRTIVITFPAFNGVQLTLYVREDGATFYDDSLLQRAG
jgi:hypothetical protein